MLEKIEQTVNGCRKLILDAERHIWKNPETGFKEWKTEKYLADAFEGLGYTLTHAGNIPGFYTDIDTGKKGPKVLIFGEMDSLICHEHPEADKETGAVHCCGHHAQCAALLGIAAALKNPAILSGLCGSIRLCAVPAEELVEVEFRQQLKDRGIIRYFSGKTEFLYRGYFDDIDIAFMIHVTRGESFVIRKGSVGFVTKRIAYKGKAAHAAGSPQKGINALYAANLGLQAVNAIRETFVEGDLVRVHSIITNGGQAANAIPANVILEGLVRAKTFEAIISENKKVNRALIGAALSIGANIDITDSPGYAPLRNDETLKYVARDAVSAIAPQLNISFADHIETGSTDMGDISCVIPSIHPYVPGAVGTSHGSDFYIEDAETACVLSAKIQLAMLALLLGDNGKRAAEVIDRKNVPYTKEQLFEVLDGMARSGDRIRYEDTAHAQIELE